MVGVRTVIKKGSQDVIFKSTGHEKARASVCLTPQAVDQKMKPFIVFKGAKHEVSHLNEKFRGKWLDEYIFNKWVYPKGFGLSIFF